MRTVSRPEAIGIHCVLLEFGIQTHTVGKCDSAAARGIADRSGTGRLKHLEFEADLDPEVCA